MKNESCLILELRSLLKRADMPKRERLFESLIVAADGILSEIAGRFTDEK